MPDANEQHIARSRELAQSILDLDAQIEEVKAELKALRESREEAIDALTAHDASEVQERMELD